MGNKITNASTATRSSNLTADETGLVPIPFYAPPNSLPEELPSWEEIEAATSGKTLLSDKRTRKIVRVRKFIVKYGVQVDFLEGQTLLFLQRNKSRLPSLRIPRVYAMFHNANFDRDVIIVECLEGWDTLQDVWHELSVREKTSIAMKLRNGIEEMRSLPSPIPGGYCSVGLGPIPDNFFWKPNNQKQISGPFQTEEEWLRGMGEVLSYVETLKPSRSAFLSRSMTSVLKGHPPVFTHGDLQRKNIMITKQANDNTAIQNSFEYQVSLVDWEFAGWYPSYWEYFTAILSCRMDDDWANYIDSTVLDPYYKEWYVCNTLFREVFY